MNEAISPSSPKFSLKSMYIYHGINLNLILPINSTLFFLTKQISFCFMSLYYSCCRHFIMYIYFWELLKLGCEGNMFRLIDSRSWLCFAAKSPHRWVVFCRQNLAAISKTPSRCNIISNHSRSS